jgi:DNA polymerase-1
VKEYTHKLGKIYVPEPDDSLEPLWELRKSGRTWAADTETTGLNVFQDGFRVRLVQVGTTDEAWVLRPEWFAEQIRYYVSDAWWHNSTYDALAMEQALGIPYEQTGATAQDTQILAQLLDPRDKAKGGRGHALKDLSDYYVLDGVKDARREVLVAAKKAMGKDLTAANMWSEVPWDLDEYLFYAGQDVLLTARLAEILEPKIRQRNLTRLSAFEHDFAQKCAQMTRIGTLFDAEYADEAEQSFDLDLANFEATLEHRWGIVKTGTYAHTSKKNVMRALAERGARFTKVSEKTGKPSLDADVLENLKRQGGEVGALATDVLAAKHAKHYGDYVRGLKAQVGKDGRIHPSVRPMGAATARMSIADPPIQQYPRNDPRIRGCLIADPGHVIVTADYAQVEYRVAAAISGDPVMKADILEGRDLHQVTAVALFGEDYLRDPDFRVLAKNVGFGRLYGGSPRGIREMMLKSNPEKTPSLRQVEKAVKAFDARYEGVAAYAKKLGKKIAAGNTTLITATGRPLICEAQHAAINYAVQSTARDVFAMGIVRIHRAGLGDNLRLVVHDESVLSVPEDEASAAVEAVTGAMETEFKGLPIRVEPEIKGKRWSK